MSLRKHRQQEIKNLHDFFVSVLPGSYNILIEWDTDWDGWQCKLWCAETTGITDAYWNALTLEIRRIIGERLEYIFDHDFVRHSEFFVLIRGGLPWDQIAKEAGILRKS